MTPWNVARTIDIISDLLVQISPEPSDISWWDTADFTRVYVALNDLSATVNYLKDDLDTELINRAREVE